MTLFAGLDLGTTTIKAVVYDADAGKVVASASHPTPVERLPQGWSQHDPEALWQTVCHCLRDAAGGLRVCALAISSMAEAGVPVDAQGRAVYPAIAWFDRRSAPQAAWIEAQLGRETIYRITGQRVTASFGATKWLWLRENHPELLAPTTRWMPLPTYILYRLCGENVVDYSIASRALFLEQSGRTWAAPILERCQITPAQLPTLRPGAFPVGALTREAAQAAGLPRAAMCVTGGHDHLCAAFAAGGVRPGAAVDSTGTAEAVMLVSPRFLPDAGLGERGFACYAHVLPGCYVLKGGLKAAGGSIEWLARLLSPRTPEPDYAALEAEAASAAGKRSGPAWLPHLLESGSPEADPLSRGALVGARLGDTRGDLFHGLLESLACWLRANLEHMQAAAEEPAESVILLGGATRLQLLSQLKANLLARPVTLPQIPEASAVGAALLAGLGAGAFSSAQEASASLRYDSAVITPDEALTDWYEQRYRQVYRPLYAALRDIHHTF